MRAAATAATLAGVLVALVTAAGCSRMKLTPSADGLGSCSGGVCAEEGYLQSRVLDRAFRDLVAEAAAGTPHGRGEALLDELRRKSCDILVVMPQEEEAFRRGEFPDEQNARTLRETIRQLTSLDLELPVIGQRIIEMDRAGRLRGARLEVATRILTCQFYEARRLTRARDAHEGGRDT